MANTNDPNNVGIVPDGMLFLAPVGTSDGSRPTSSASSPGDGVVRLGYYSEDGYELTGVPGDANNILGHNGDVLDDSALPGWWTVKFSAVESKKAVVETYFDAVVNLEEASITVSKASSQKYWELWAIAIRKNGDQVLKFFPKVRVSDRDAIQYNRANLIGYGMTFKTFADPSDDPLLDENGKPAHFKIFDPLFLVS